MSDNFNPWEYSLDQIFSKYKVTEDTVDIVVIEKPKNLLGDDPHIKKILEKFNDS